MLHAIFSLLPFFVCALLTLELIFLPKDRARRWLLCWAAVATLLYLCHALFFFQVHTLQVWRHAVYVMCNLLVYPLFLIYISELTQQRPISSSPSRLAACLSPALVGGGVLIAVLGMTTPDEAAAFGCQYIYKGCADGLGGMALVAARVGAFCKILFAVEVVAVMVLGSAMLRRYDVSLELYYADVEGRTLHRVRWLLYFFGLIVFVSFFANLLGVDYFLGSDMLLALPSLVFSALLFGIGFVCKRLSLSEIRRNAAADDSPCDETASAAADTSDGKYSDKALRLRLEALMKESRLYLQSDLRLADVALQLGTNRTYLLQTLREDFGMTFSEYVNRQRIEYAKQVIAEHPDWEKTHIAQMAGYASYSSFYHNMKLYAGKA